MSPFTRKYLLNGFLILLSVTKTLNSLPQLEIGVGLQDVDNSTAVDIVQLEPMEKMMLQCEIRKIKERYGITFSQEELLRGTEDPRIVTDLLHIRLFNSTGDHNDDMMILFELGRMSENCASEIEREIHHHYLYGGFSRCIFHSN